MRGGGARRCAFGRRGIDTKTIALVATIAMTIADITTARMDISVGLIMSISPIVHHTEALVVSYMLTKLSIPIARLKIFVHVEDDVNSKVSMIEIGRAMEPWSVG